MLYAIEMTLGKRIKIARERINDLTQEAVGAEFGITDKAVSAWERGDTRPDNAKLVKLAKILKVPLTWLMDGKGPPPAPEALESVMDRLTEEERDMLRSMAQTLLQRRERAA